MLRRLAACLSLLMLAGGGAARAGAFDAPIKVDGGLVAPAAADSSGVRAFKGMPYAAPPIGALRWHAPEPVEAWSGVRRSDRFGDACAQHKVYGDIDPYTPGMSENCLYLNVWTPARQASERLPVMVWIYGGGFSAGSGSEPRHDGVALAKQGVVVVTLNYRLGVFGFLATPELSAETGWRGSGNWGLMDQAAALGWVRRNIAAFGGDPAKVTIFGESAGSWSVSALTASPLAHGLFRAAIGESGAVFPAEGPGVAPLAEAEAHGLDSVRSLNARTLADLRRLSTGQLLDLQGSWRPDVDGHVLPDTPAHIFAAGRENAVPLIAGFNSDEGTGFAPGVFKGRPYRQAMQDIFGDRAGEVEAAYPANAEEARRLFGGDAVIAYPTWAWAEAMRKTGDKPTWFYLFDRHPGAPEGVRNRTSHADDIVYVFDHPDVRPDIAMTDVDRRIARDMSGYWVNFAKTLDPNGPGPDGKTLPRWPAYDPAHGADAKMRFEDEPVVTPDEALARFRVLDRVWGAGRAPGS